MNHDENMTYEWLNELRQKRLKLLQEQDQKDVVRRASSSRSAFANKFGDFAFQTLDNGNIKITSGGPQITQATLTCATNNSTATVQFNSTYVRILQDAYYSASKKSGYCPKPSQGYAPQVVRGKLFANIPVYKRNLSSHAFGTAIDFDAERTPMEGPEK